MAIDLKNFSPKELQALIANANAQMHNAHAAQVQSVKQKIETLLRNSGLTLNDLYPSRAKAPGKKGAKGAVAPKYSNPSNPSETWSGRGRQPAWFAKALKRRGITADTLLIGSAAKRPPATAKSGSPGKRVAKRASKKVAGSAKA